MKSMINCYKKVQTDILNNYFAEKFNNHKYYIQKDIEEKTVYLASSCWIVKMPLEDLAISDNTVTPMQKLKEIFEKTKRNNTETVISEMSQDINGATHIILTAKDCITHIDKKYRNLFPNEIDYKITYNRTEPVMLYFDKKPVAVVFPIMFAD